MDAVDLVNMALRETGAGDIAVLDDTTPEGKMAGDIYTFKRDLLLRSHPWNFATARVRLNRLSASPNSEWAYAYEYPSDWVRTIAVADNDGAYGSLEYRQESIWVDRAVNGDFDADSSWTKGTGWTIADGVATHAVGVASDLSQAATLTVGTSYRVQYTISNRNTGTITPKLIGGTTVSGTPRDANGTWINELVAVTGNNALAFGASDSFDGSIDDVTLINMGLETVQALVTDAPEVFLRYIRKVTIVDAMSPGFKQALVYLMAKVFSTGLASSNSLRQLNDEDLRRALSLARSIDGMEDYPDRMSEGSWASSRRGGGWRRGSVWPS